MNDAAPHHRATDAGLLRRTALAGFQAVCEAFYPDNDLGAPSWRDADMVARAARHWDALPPGSRYLVETLFASMQLGGAALAPGLGPLSRVPVEKRAAMFSAWKKSRVWPLRFAAEALKSATTMLYMSHPAVMRHVGITKACGDEALHGVPVRKGAFDQLLPRAGRAGGAA